MPGLVDATNNGNRDSWMLMLPITVVKKKKNAIRTMHLELFCMLWSVGRNRKKAIS